MLTALSSYPYVYLSVSWTVNCFNFPMFLLLNITMLYAVIKTRFFIVSKSHLFPNENLIVVHVILFTAVTAIWLAVRIYTARHNRAREAYFAHKTDEHYLNYLVTLTYR